MRIFGIPNCDSCRLARKSLPGAEFQDIREKPLTHAEIEIFCTNFGDALVNRRSTTWRGLSDEDRALPIPELIAKVPTVMKRPVIDQGGSLTLGFDAKVRAALGV